MTDPLISKALTFIQANLGTALAVGAVAKHLNLSRRMLELKARQSFVRTIWEEIQRLCFERVRGRRHKRWCEAFGTSGFLRDDRVLLQVRGIGFRPVRSLRTRRI